MTEKLVKLAPVKRGDAEFTAYLREIADRFEAGEISEIIVITHDRQHYDYRTHASWEDRWRALGAIENAKSKVLLSD
jgi:hypothetical protein